MPQARAGWIQGGRPISVDNQLRTEEDARAELLRDLRYDVSLTLTDDVNAQRFTSRSVVDLVCTEDGAETFINLRAAALVSAIVNGRQLTDDEHRFDGNRVRVPGLRRGANRVEVTAECVYERSGAGLHRFRDPVDGCLYLYTQCEPFDAHRVLACFDQPNLKAPLRLHVEGPSGWTVCANAPVTASRTDGDRTTWDFATTPPLPPYLFAIVAGDYEVVEGPAHGAVPLALLCRRSLATHVRQGAEPFFDVTLRGLRHFESRYGHPYPFGAYNQVFVPEANMGAMENPGCVTFNEMFVFRGPVSALQLMRRANVILHEMVHVMGFGDVVTMRDWGDLWLNETFATVEATIASDALGIEGAWVDFAGSVKSRALQQDQLTTTHPIIVDPPDTESIRANFDGITYHKGASALRQLIAWVGDEAYAEGIRSYFREFAWANASRTDFLRHQSAASGRDLGEWARLWLETAGVNTLLPRPRDRNGVYGEVGVEQLPDVASKVLRPHHLSVGLYRREGEQLVRQHSTQVEVTGKTATVEMAGEAVADLLVVNDDDLTFAKLRFDERSLATLLSGGVSAIADPLARSLCWTALHDMTRDAELSTADFVAAVVAQAGRESDPTLLERVLSLAVAAAAHFSADAKRAASLTALAELAAGRLRETDPLVWARCLVASAHADKHLDLLQRLVDGDLVVPGLVVDDELRWAILARLCAAGRSGAEQVQAALELDPSDAGQRHALSCLAARPLVEAKAAAWASAFDDPQPSRARLVASLSGFTTGLFPVGGFWGGGRDQAALTEAYVDPYLESVAGVWDRLDYEVARVISESLFPHEPPTDTTVGAVERLLEQPNLPWNARRILMEGLDGLRRACRARAADAAAA